MHKSACSSSLTKPRSTLDHDILRSEIVSKCNALAGKETVMSIGLRVGRLIYGICWLLRLLSFGLLLRVRAFALVLRGLRSFAPLLYRLQAFALPLPGLGNLTSVSSIFPGNMAQFSYDHDVIRHWHQRMLSWCLSKPMAFSPVTGTRASVSGPWSGSSYGTEVPSGPWTSTHPWICSVDLVGFSWVGAS